MVKISYTVLRIVMGLIFVTHGAARLYYDSVAGFGAYLDSQGFHIGLLMAWVITIGEIVSGTLLAFGYKVRFCVMFHAVIILSGIVMLHLSHGWFVVGHGSNGIEYSVLILAVLLFIYSRDE